MLARLRSLADALFRRTRFEDGMADELRFHVEAYADDLEREGVPRDEALRRARVEFGGVERVKDEARQARGLRLFDELRQDLRYAVRQLRRTPGFAAAAVLSLALGIGANTAIFSLMDFVLLKTMPVNSPEQLYFLGHGTAVIPNLSSNYALLERYRQNVDAFSGITAYNTQQFKVTTPAGTELVDGQYVAGNYHDVLGVGFAIGRGFAGEPDRPSSGSLVAVISGDYWTLRFGRDPAVIGRTITVQRKTVTIIGVTRPEFHGFRPGTRFDVTLPLALRVMDEPDFITMRDSWISVNLIGRLRPSVSEAQALSALDPVFRQFWMEPDNAWARQPVAGQPGVADHPARLSPAGRGTSTLRLRYSEPLRVLMAMVALVLLIACGNVANLLLVKAPARAKEVAVRISLGAGRARLVRQFLTESATLALAGGLVGLLLARWATTAIAFILNTGTEPVLIDVHPNGRVVAFTTAISAMTAIVCGLFPAFKATSVDLTPSLKDAPRSNAGARRSTAGLALVIAQVAVSVLLVAGTGLLVRSFINLKTLDGGFRKDHLLLFWLDARGTTSSVTDLSARVIERIQSLPGVRGASLSTMSPLATNLEVRGFRLADDPATAPMKSADSNRITTDYFATLDVALVRGRGFLPADARGAPRVAVVNETMAREYFAETDPIGRTFSFGSTPGEPVTIVGIARDIRQRSLRERIQRMAYVPLAQAEEPPGMVTVTVRTSEEPRRLEPAVRDAVQSTSPDLVMSYVRTMDEQIDASLVRERLLATISGAFGILALVLAAVGLFGVFACNVARRTREIGIRLALGAQPSTILLKVILEAIAVSAVGIAIGLAAAMVATRIVSSFLFELSARDPLTFGVSAVVLLLTTVLAGYLPARRAASVDPILALRTE